MTYQFFCDACNYRRVTDGTDLGDLVAVKASPVPGGAPRLENGRTVTPEAKQLKKKFKCPQCGRAISAKKITREDNGKDHAERGEAGFAGWSF